MLITGSTEQDVSESGRLMRVLIWVQLLQAQGGLGSCLGGFVCHRCVGCAPHSMQLHKVCLR